MLKGKTLKLGYFALLFSVINVALYHGPFFDYVSNNVDTKSFSGILLIFSLVILAIVVNAFVFYIGLYLLRNVGKWIMALFFIINSISIYFINTYSVILDRSMMGNVFNTDYEESSSFFSFKLILYVVFLGIIPCLLLFRYKIVRVKLKRFLTTVGLTLLFLVSLAWVNASNWLWIDKNSTKLGALAMPWSYVVNSCRYFYKQSQDNKQEILLPDAKILNDKKEIAVLVIGESARRENFSLYGYRKDTNPLLSKMPNIHKYMAQSCATYTTAGVKCILEHENTSKLYEILPNYLDRNGVDVIWRTTNWGEPPVKVKNYTNKDALRQQCKGQDCEYDGVLLDGLKEQILASKKNKILVVLHTSTSHGPTYFEKYPERFKKFSPECKNVELAKCTNQELINAYDNTIVYTDYLLATLINDLKEMKEYESSMIFVSDHGESLGENNLYMHGLPVSMAPKDQLEIPFIVWTSPNGKKLKNKTTAEQHNVFHTVLDFLSIGSPIFDKNMSLVE